MWRQQDDSAAERPPLDGLGDLSSDSEYTYYMRPPMFRVPEGVMLISRIRPGFILFNIRRASVKISIQWQAQPCQGGAARLALAQPSCTSHSPRYEHHRALSLPGVGGPHVCSRLVAT